MRLYEIDREIEEFEGLLAEAEGELNEEMEKDWQRLIENREDKWRSYIAVVRQLEAEETGYQAEVDRLKKAVQARTKSITWLKQQLLWSLDQAGMTEAKTDIGKVKIMKASSRPVLLKVKIEDLPEVYTRILVEPKLSEIGKGLKDHDPMAEEVAEFGPAKLYVRIF